VEPPWCSPVRASKHESPAFPSGIIGTSNQLGECESGVTAHWFGTVPAVLIGGAGTLIVVLLWIRFFSQPLHIDRFEQ